MGKQYIEVTNRDLAKVFTRALPVEGEEYREVVETYLEVVKAMSKQSRLALKVAYIFSQKVPREEREDLFQDIALAVLKSQNSDEKLAYSIARLDWLDWWRRYKVRQHYSLDSVADDGEGNETTLAELLVGETEFEAKLNGEIEGQRIWDKLPEDIKPLIVKRLIGKALTHQERNKINYWVKTKGYQLLLN